MIHILARKRWLSFSLVLLLTASVLASQCFATQWRDTGAAPLPPVDCSKYPPLTGEKFLQLYSAIAAHSDLRDVPFIEETLQVKFSSRYLEPGGKQDVHWRLYGAPSILGAPVRVSLTAIDDDDPENKSSSVASMYFISDPQNYLPECLHITRKQFVQVFPHEKTPSHLEKAGPGRMAVSKMLDGEGENHKIGISATLVTQDYSKVNDDSIIEQLSIGQAK